MSSINEHLGKMVSTLRKAKGWTQQELADRSDLSRVTIGQIERGNAEPSISNLNKIASALECNLDIIMTPVNVD